MTETREELYVL
uniref:Uncharacterized protein n=1 Tax=Anguilla anguilla TaxID=7936 RepID=A0A0E9U2X5_ANGAN